jgi:EAL domain-containing protein (putative c-di-GMP-specific phosphodiesterase class I)
VLAAALHIAQKTSSIRTEIISEAGNFPTDLYIAQGLATLLGGVVTVRTVAREQVLATLARTHAKPKLLKLELTESMLVEDVEGIIAKMSALKGKGVGFSLDDFGTGYSSLAYLKRLPLDQLKIDQGFVRNIVSAPNDVAIAKMVVALAETMGLAVIAEGVEMQAQADFLAHLGCHAYQGYLFSKPLPIASFEVFAASTPNV